MTVFALFENDGDGCSWSTETLVGVFETKSDAETEILRRVELVEWYEKHKSYFQREVAKASDQESVKKLEEAWKVRLTNKGINPEYIWNSLPHGDVNNYEIEELTVGKTRL